MQPEHLIIRDITYDSKRMEYCDRFERAAGEGDIEELKRLLALLIEPEEREYIIHHNDNLAFQIAAKNGHVGALKYLMKLASDYEERVKMFNMIKSYALGNIHIEIMESLLSMSTQEQALRFIEDNIQPNVLLEAAKKNILHILWYTLDTKITKRIEWYTHKIPSLIHLSLFLSVSYPVLLQQIKIPDIVEGNQIKSLIILNTMLVPIVRLYKVCKSHDEFLILKLPQELIHKILWYNIIDSIADLIPETNRCFDRLISLISFYTVLRERQIVITINSNYRIINSTFEDLNDKISYILSFLENFNKFIFDQSQSSLALNYYGAR